MTGPTGGATSECTNVQRSPLRHAPAAKKRHCARPTGAGAAAVEADAGASSSMPLGAAAGVAASSAELS